MKIGPEGQLRSAGASAEGVGLRRGLRRAPATASVRSRASAVGVPVAPPLVADRDDRERQDHDHRLVDVLAQRRERGTEEVAGQHHDRHPQHRTDDAPEPEPATRQPGHAGDERDVGPHERHEPAQHQSHVAVLVEEVGGLVEVLALQDPAVVLAQRLADLSAYLVARDVAGHRGHHHQHHREQQLDDVVAREDVDLVGGDEQPDREQQGVTGQEREQQPALDEDDQQADPEELRAELLEQPVGVHPLDAEQHRHGVHHGAQRVRHTPQPKGRT